MYDGTIFFCQPDPDKSTVIMVATDERMQHGERQEDFLRRVKDGLVVWHEARCVSAKELKAIWRGVEVDDRAQEVSEVRNQDVKFYLDVLQSEECQCGRWKAKKKALCWNCWKRLPNDVQRALYRPLRAGFEAAYEVAVKYLTECE